MNDQSRRARTRRRPWPARAEMLALLFRQSTPAMYFSVAVAIVVAIPMWAAVERWAILTWLGLILLAFVLRAVLFLAYGRARPSGAQVLKWYWPYVATLLFSAAVWGFGLLWLMPTDSVLHQALAYVFLLGMASSALTAYSAVREIALATFIVTLMPAAIWFLFQGDVLRVAMGLGGLLYLASSWRATAILARAMHRNIQLTHELDSARASAELAAQTDELTGLKNRRAFTELGERALHRCRRAGRPVSVMVLDLDQFKSINDRFGHAAGDRALILLSRAIRDCLREDDVCGRLGGEEFAVVMPGTSDSDALQVAERIRQAIGQTRLSGDGKDYNITVSVGVAFGAGELDELINQADLAMYQAKEQGGNRIETTTK